MHALVVFLAVVGLIWFVAGRTAARVFVVACAVVVVLVLTKSISRGDELPRTAAYELR